MRLKVLPKDIQKFITLNLRALKIRVEKKKGVVALSRLLPSNRLTYPLPFLKQSTRFGRVCCNKISRVCQWLSLDSCFSSTCEKFRVVFVNQGYKYKSKKVLAIAPFPFLILFSLFLRVCSLLRDSFFFLVYEQLFYVYIGCIYIYSTSIFGAFFHLFPSKCFGANFFFL